jgi:perosamine synthetase
VSSAKIPLSKPILDEEMKEAALYALQNERFVFGESVHKFEEEFARYCGTKFAVSTASGTAALVLSLVAQGVRGGEVVTTPASFVASANSIIHSGATPRFADIVLEDYTIDPSRVRTSICSRTKAIIPVHLYGYPATMNELCEVASEHGISVIEDACQAHGASYNDRKLGSIGEAGCFSFFPSKNMTVGGDGGMVVTNDEVVKESVASLRDCGRAKGSKYLHDKIGYTERLNTVQAAIGRVQLKRLDAWNESRRQIASQYDRLLSDLDGLVTPPRENTLASPVYHMYVIRCPRRDDLRAWLDHAGVETGIHYPDPIHLQPIYREMFGFKGGEFPNSETLCRNALSIPMHPALTPDEVKYVSESIRKFYQPEKQASQSR